MSLRPRRTALYCPASSARAIASARRLVCDVVILDLEDAVAPEAKDEARDQAVAALAAGGFGDCEVVLRVNGLETAWGAADLAALPCAGLDAVLVPKVNAAADLVPYAEALAPRIALWAMIETARSLFRLDEIGGAAAAVRLAALVIGTNDLALETGARPDVLRAPFLGALGLGVAAARAHRLVILDGVFNDIEDEAGFMAQARQGAAFGFDGKTLIHPRQIAPCRAAFTPDAAACAWARRVVDAFDDPAHHGRGVLRLDGRMVERLHLVQARRILAAAG